MKRHHEIQRCVQIDELAEGRALSTAAHSRKNRCMRLLSSMRPSRCGTTPGSSATRDESAIAVQETQETPVERDVPITFAVMTAGEPIREVLAAIHMSHMSVRDRNSESLIPDRAMTSSPSSSRVIMSVIRPLPIAMKV